MCVLGGWGPASPRPSTPPPVLLQRLGCSASPSPSNHHRVPASFALQAEPRPPAPARPYQGNPTFDPEFIRSKSTAAAGLCSWCINIVRFYEVYCDVAPKRQALGEANAELAEAQEKLSRIKNKIAVGARPQGPPRHSTPRAAALGDAGTRGLLRASPRHPASSSPPHPLVLPGTQRQSQQPDVGV